MKLNNAVKRAPVYTHEGAQATWTPSNAEALRRAVMSCLLWEDEFYESGQSITQRIAALVPIVKPADVAAYAIKARTDMKLRHVPLLLVREMARASREHRLAVADTLAAVIQRPDEISEFLAIYWKDGKQPLSAQVKKGLARAFTKFKDRALAKYNRDGAVKLRDALFLCHAKPNDLTPTAGLYTKVQREQVRQGKAQAVLTPMEKRFLSLVEGTLATPDTWEVALSGGADKKATFERLIVESQLGALALLRNLRNMDEAGVDKSLVSVALDKMDVSRVLPHRFIAAARAVPQWEDIIEVPMINCAATLPPLRGRTLFLIDVSGSMDGNLSAKSGMTRLDAACGLAIIGREMCEEVAVVTFSDGIAGVPPRRGFALRDAICQSQRHAGTRLGAAVSAVNQDVGHNRIIVITDEQSADLVPAPNTPKAYMINVASNKNGVGYGKWNKIDGFSEAVLRYIAEFEAAQ